ncbi:MAG: hypothetical protein V7668_00775, partial [Cereibacter changlensis]
MQRRVTRFGPRRVERCSGGMVGGLGAGQTVARLQRRLMRAAGRGQRPGLRGLRRRCPRPLALRPG